MLARHIAGIERRSTCQTRPERANQLQVFRPIRNLRVKNGTDELMLPNISIKMPQQFGESFASANPVVKRVNFYNAVHGWNIPRPRRRTAIHFQECELQFASR